MARSVVTSLCYSLSESQSIHLSFASAFAFVVVQFFALQQYAGQWCVCYPVGNGTQRCWCWTRSGAGVIARASVHMPAYCAAHA